MFFRFNSEKDDHANYYEEQKQDKFPFSCFSLIA